MNEATIIIEIRRALADYMYSEGCGCCRGDDHDDHAEVLAKLLNVEPYDDGSGYDFSKYRTKKGGSNNG